MVSTREDLVAVLLEQVPNLRELYDEHMEFYEELLPSVFFGEVVPWVVDDFVATAGTAPSGHWKDVLDTLEREYHGSLEVEELIDFSFLEILPRPDERGHEIVEHLGPNLTAAWQEVVPTTPDDD